MTILCIRCDMDPLFIGEKSEDSRDPITCPTLPDFKWWEEVCSAVTASGVWAIEPLLNETGRLRILGFQISGIISFFEDIINTAQRGKRGLDTLYIWPKVMWIVGGQGGIQTRLLHFKIYAIVHLSVFLLPHDSPSYLRRQLSYLSDSSLQVKHAEYFQLYLCELSLHLDCPPPVCDCPSSSLSSWTHHRALCGLCVVWQAQKSPQHESS